MTRRIQRRRTKGWRMPEGAVYVGRPSLWGNPFPVRGEIAPWMALACGQRADEAGRQFAAVLCYRAWMTGEPVVVPTRETPDGSVIEYSDGTQVAVADVVQGMGVMMLSKSPIPLPRKPDIAPLRDKDLVCWCPLDQPCHADVLLELAAAASSKAGAA